MEHEDQVTTHRLPYWADLAEAEELSSGGVDA